LVGSGLEFGNSRKQHETAAIRKHKLPDDMMLIAGVIDSKSNMVEHPEVVAQRIEGVVTALGNREQVIAGVDCGFGTFVGWEWVTEDVVWAKLKTLHEGADIASRRPLGQEGRLSKREPISFISLMAPLSTPLTRAARKNPTSRAATAAIQPVRPPFPTRPVA
jgi:hypothetical protein